MRPQLEPVVGDPDDHRPASRLGFAVDPGQEDAGRVDTMCMIIEDLAPGDHIPLHRHPIDEAVLAVSGSAEIAIGSRRWPLAPGDAAFIPAGVAHGTRNTGSEDFRLHAFFGSTRIGVEYLERNPGPGAKDHVPACVEYDLRTGEVRPLDRW